MARTFLVADTEYLYNLNPPVTVAPFSMSCWYYYTASINQTIFSLADKDVDNHVFQLYASSTDKLAWSIRSGGTWKQTASFATTTSADEWNHSGVVEAADNDHNCFMNGAKRSNSDVRAPVGVDRFCIGVRADSTLSVPFGGKLSEFGWWNVALSDEEMAILNLGYSPLLIRPQSLIAYIPMIRDDDEDLIGGLSMSVAGTPTVGKHSRAYYPRK